MEKITLDHAQSALIEALARLVDDQRYTETGHAVDLVVESGASRHERLVSFDLVAEDGAIRSFTATITADE